MRAQLLFMLIFFFFSYAATWLFSDENEDFADLASSMTTQVSTDGTAAQERKGEQAGGAGGDGKERETKNPKP